jgi:hypothetical protein
MEHLQEQDDAEGKRVVEKDKCCNGSGCNPSLYEIPILLPKAKADMKPSAGSFAGLALDKIASWCDRNAEELVPREQRRMPLVGDWWMQVDLQYAVARGFSKARTGARKLPFGNVAQLVECVPILRQWSRLEEQGQYLVDYCMDILPAVVEEWDAGAASRSRKHRPQGAPVTGADGAGPSTT